MCLRHGWKLLSSWYVLRGFSQDTLNWLVFVVVRVKNQNKENEFAEDERQSRGGKHEQLDRKSDYISRSRACLYKPPTATATCEPPLFTFQTLTCSLLLCWALLGIKAKTTYTSRAMKGNKTHTVVLSTRWWLSYATHTRKGVDFPLGLAQWPNQPVELMWTEAVHP